MQKFFVRMPQIIQIVSAVFIALFFVPLASEYGISFSCLNLLVGIKVMGINVGGGTFSIIFVALVPLAILIIRFMKINRIDLITLGLSIIGFFITGRLSGAVNDVTSGTSWVVVSSVFPSVPVPALT